MAAGLDRAGFDPKIVIDDDNFRRRDSPPGSNDEPGLYQRPFAETVSDLGIYNAASSEKGRAVSDPGYVVDDEIPSGLSKRERKRLEKEARRQGIEARDLEPLPEDVNTALEPVVVSAEETFDTPRMSKKEQKKRDQALRAAQFAQGEESFSPREPLVESAAKEDAWADAPPERPIEAADDERTESSSSKKKKKKSKRSSVVQEENGDSRSETQRSEPAADDWAEEVNRAEALRKLEGTAGPAEDDWADSSSSKKKKKSKSSKKSSSAWDDDQDAASTDNRRASVPIDELRDIRPDPEAEIDDDWETSEMPKKRSTGDAAPYESLSVHGTVRGRNLQQQEEQEGPAQERTIRS